MKGSLKNNGAYFKSTDLELSLPLTIFLVCDGFDLLLGPVLMAWIQTGKDPESLGIAHEVTPYLLFQAFLTYEKNPSLADYNTFVVSMKGTSVQFVRASCSNSYLRDLVDRKAPQSSLDLHFSKPYDLLEQDYRKEFVRVFIGLVNYLHELLNFVDN